MSQTPSTHTSTPKFKLLYSRPIQLWWLSYIQLTVWFNTELTTDHWPAGRQRAGIAVYWPTCGGGRDNSLPGAVSAWGLNGLAKTAQETSYTRSAVKRVRSCSWRRPAKAGNWHFNCRQPVSGDSQAVIGIQASRWIAHSSVSLCAWH